MSLDYAIDEDINNADQQLTLDRVLDKNNIYVSYFINQMQFCNNNLQLSGKTMRWLDNTEQLLSKQ